MRVCLYACMHAHTVSLTAASMYACLSVCLSVYMSVCVHTPIISHCGKYTCMHACMLACFTHTHHLSPQQVNVVDRGARLDDGERAGVASLGALWHVINKIVFVCVFVCGGEGVGVCVWGGGGHGCLW